MKKSILSILAVAMIFFTSCEGEDRVPSSNNGGQSGSFVLDAGDFKGQINDGTVTLDATVVYNLTGALVVNDGATLNIPAGTRIEATAGTSSYIAVAQGGMINANGTAASPIVMTSGLTNPAPGDWGGLVICGKAPINKGTTASAEVSDLTYGGTDANDNSGVYRYMRIEYAGATFNSSKEFNALSVFGVGAGTTIDYVQAYEGNDDGFEFFGGTVVANHLVVINPTDDAFDWTEGWTGAGTDWYADLTNGRGHRGIEADNLESDNSATPVSNPTITNITVLGNGDGTEDDGFKIRRGTKGTFLNCVIDGYAEAIEIDNAATVANFVDGSLTFTNIALTNFTSTADIDGTDYATFGDVATAYSSATFTEDAAATGAGNTTTAPVWTAGWTLGL